jgi:hypothetical protein
MNIFYGDNFFKKKYIQMNHKLKVIYRSKKK